jgi:hypothetical protein
MHSNLFKYMFCIFNASIFTNERQYQWKIVHWGKNGTVMGVRSNQKELVVNFLKSWTTICFSRRTFFHGVSYLVSGTIVPCRFLHKTSVCFFSIQCTPVCIPGNLSKIKGCTSTSPLCFNCKAITMHEDTSKYDFRKKALPETVCLRV